MITKEYLQQELRRRIDGIKPGVETTTDNIIAEMKSVLVLVEALQDYEKKYNEALERARYVLHTVETAGCAMHKDLLTEIFPELHESEDERIRKVLINYFKGSVGLGVALNGVSVKDIVAYLEKQKEQKPISFYEPYNPDDYEVVMEGNATILKRKEQKSAEWSEEDKKELDCIINILDRLGFEEFCKSSRDQDVEEERFYYKEIQFLKRLKSLRPSWKPSEEQMDALKELIDDANRAGWVTPGATDLYEQLKKL